MSQPRYGFQHSVLFIDDFSKTEQLIRSGLLFCPIQFEFCPNDYEIAMQKIVQVKPDLIVSSLEFKMGSVVEFIEKTRKNFSQLPAIYLTEPHLDHVQNSIFKWNEEINLIARPTSEPSELVKLMEKTILNLPTHRMRRAQSA
jgi:two-component SAPR family response regulator